MARRLTLAVLVASLAGAGGWSATASAQAPVNTAAPTISSAQYTVGKTFTSTPGTWSGEQPITFTYRWRRCINGNTDNCEDVDETADRFTTTAVDQADSLRLVVTARNAAAPGGVTAQSAPTPIIGASAGNVPTATASGAIGPVDQPRPAGTVFSAANRTWSEGAATAAHRWYRCTGADPLSCEWIPDATAKDYASGDADARRTLRVKIVGANANTHGLVVSDFTPALLLATPASQQPPTIAGSPYIGDTLTGGPGGWRGAELAFAYVWEVCDDLLGRCDPIPGATASTFRVPRDAIGRRLRVVVTATNGSHPTYSRATATSAQTAPVSERPAPGSPAPPPPTPAAPAAPTTPLLPAVPTLALRKPTALAKPRITGAARVGARLRCNGGRWSGGARLAYSWLRNRKPIRRATKSTYRVTRRDRGARVACRLRATNAAGTTTVTTPALRIRR